MSFIGANVDFRDFILWNPVSGDDCLQADNMSSLGLTYSGATSSGNLIGDMLRVDKLKLSSSFPYAHPSVYH